MNCMLPPKSTYFAMDCDVSPDRGSDHTILLATHEIVSSDDYQSSPDSIHHHHHHHHQIHNYSLHPQSISNDDDDEDDVIFDIDQPPPLLQVEEDRDPLALDDAAEEELLRLQSPPKLDINPPLSILKQQHVPRINAKTLALDIKEKTTTSPTSDSSTKTSSQTQAAKPRKPASTMREVLASLPGFSVKPRRRSNKKMSTAAQIEQTKNGKIDLETPDSILVSTNLRALLNKQTFSLLPPLFQHSLVQLLPSVDRPSAIDGDSAQIRLNASALNNEFFARACLDWRERLAGGELTPENQNKLKTEAEREMSKLDPWKLKHFEPIWGDKSYRSKKISSDSNSDDRPTIGGADATHTSTTTSTTINSSNSVVTPTNEPAPAPPPTPETPLSQGSSGSSVIVECSDVPSSSTRTSLSPCRPLMTASSMSNSSPDTNVAEITISSSNSSTSSVEIIEEYQQEDENRLEVSDVSVHDEAVEIPSQVNISAIKNECKSGRDSVMDVMITSSPKQIDSEVEEVEISSEIENSLDQGQEKDQSQNEDLKYLHDDNGLVLYEIEVDMADINDASQSEENSTGSQRAEKRASSPEDRESKHMKLNEMVEWEEVDSQQPPCVDNVSNTVDELIPDGEIPMTAAEMEVFSTFTSNSNSNSLSDCSNQSISEVIVEDDKLALPPDVDEALIAEADDNILIDEVSLPPSPLLESVVYADDQSSLSPAELPKDVDDNEELVSTTVDEVVMSPMPMPILHEEIQQDESNSLLEPYIEIDPSTEDLAEIETPIFESQSQTMEISEIMQSQQPRVSSISDSQYLHAIQRPPSSSSPTIYRLALSPSTQLKVISTGKVENVPEVSRPQATIVKIPVSSTSSTQTTVASTSIQSVNALNALVGSNGRGRRATSNLPPGAVNLERSYQICQAVIQNSPNRHQLKAQLKPPPFIVNSNSGSTSGVGTSNSVLSTPTTLKVENQLLGANNPPVVYKVITAPRLGFPRKKIVHRQFSSPTIVRHLYTTDTNLSNVPQTGTTTTTTVPLRVQQQYQSQQPLQQHHQTTTVSLSTAQQQFGQYVLIQRANLATSDNQVPRASSAPPAQSQQQIQGMNGLLNNNSTSIRMRPASASVDVEMPNDDAVQDVYVIETSSGLNAITTKTTNHGLTYNGDVSSTNSAHQLQHQHRHHHPSNQQAFNKRVTGENTPPNCSCSLNAMVVCQQCGAYCQDDCIGSSKLCVACTIR